MSATPRAAGLVATTGVLRQTGLQSLVLLVALVALELLTQKNSPGDWQWLPLVATPEQGVELRLELGTTGPLDLFVLDRSSTLPTQFADLARAIPPNPLASATLIGHRFSVGPSRP